MVNVWVLFEVELSKVRIHNFVLMQTFSSSTRSQNDEFPLIITHSPLENDEPLIMPGWIFSVACVNVGAI